MTAVPSLPNPPDAYWANVPWWAYLGFMLMALLIVVVIGPWLIQRARGAPSAILSREQALAAREERADKEREADFAKLRTDMETVEADRDKGWDLGRGMEFEAHGLWHYAVNTAQWGNALLLLCQRFVAGKVSQEAFAEIVGSYSPPAPPGKLPRLGDVTPKRPEETKYQ